MRDQYRFMKPPAPIRRAKLDNVALVPGNLLPQIHHWHQLVSELPKDELVIVLPENDGKQRQLLTRVALLLQSHGHDVRVISFEEVSRSSQLDL